MDLLLSKETREIEDLDIRNDGTSEQEIEDDEEGTGFFSHVREVSYDAELIAEVASIHSEEEHKIHLNSFESPNQNQKIDNSPKPALEESPPELIKTSEPISDELKECTFRPKINSYKGTKRNDIPLKKRIDAWMESYKSKQKKQRTLKKALESEEMKECTFKPKILKKGPPRPASIVDRLYESSNMRYAVRERRKQRIEDGEANQYPFRPKIKKSKYLGENYRPIYERVGQLQREKSDKSHHLKKKHTQEEKFTFKPKINKKSRKIAREMRVSEGDVSDRLNQRASTNVLRSIRRKCIRQEHIEKECTFKPKINKCESFKSKQKYWKK